MIGCRCFERKLALEPLTCARKEYVRSDCGMRLEQCQIVEKAMSVWRFHGRSRGKIKSCNTYFPQKFHTPLSDRLQRHG